MGLCAFIHEALHSIDAERMQYLLNRYIPYGRISGDYWFPVTVEVEGDRTPYNLRLEFLDNILTNLEEQYREQSQID